MINRAFTTISSFLKVINTLVHIRLIKTVSNLYSAKSCWVVCSRCPGKMYRPYSIYFLVTNFYLQDAMSINMIDHEYRGTVEILLDDFIKP